jgi:hypothetical protein
VAVNSHRYRNYRYVSQLLASDLFNAFERDILRDAAEGLLLMSSPDSFDLGEHEATVDAALAGLEAGKRIDAETAAALRKRITECGPREATVVAA